MSDQMGRIYDKGREQADRENGQGGTRCEVIPQGKIWRYEVEFKAYRAKKVAHYLSEKSGLWPDVNTGIGGMVAHWFLDRDVSLPYELQWDILGFSAELSATVTDDEKTLNWLSTQVSPSVARLLKSGKRDEILLALGLELDNSANEW